MKKRALSLAVACLLLIFALSSCLGGAKPLSELYIKNGGRITLEVGSVYKFETNADGYSLSWSSSSDACSVDENGTVTAKREGKAAISASYGSLKATAIVDVVAANESLDSAERKEFYGDYTPAKSREEALERSEQGLISGSITVPDQAPKLAESRPMKNGLFVRNENTYYEDANTYTVVNVRGEEVFTVYRGGGYITLEEVAAYLYAFGDVPANYVEGKNAEPEGSIWGEYLRLNHSKFSGDTERYPYEPELPDISGCGGELYYYEIDIGTTGTDCDPRYIAKTYNDGQTITRGAARIVYTRYDKNRNEIIEPNEKYVFYTYNHYNDFCEYLNYYGGWGETFGNITGGGEISSKTNCNPTPYVPTEWGKIEKTSKTVSVYTFYVNTWIFDYAKRERVI